MSDVKAEGAKVEKKSNAKPEQVQTVAINVDRTDEQILQLAMDPGVVMTWDAKSFRKLDNSVINLLKGESLKSYLRAEGAWEATRPVAKKRMVNPLMPNPLSGYSEAREEVRKRRGWHQCWANPGRDFDEKMRGPYKQVREPTDEQRKKGFEPGEENGEVKKRLDGEGKVEAIALECPQELFEEYLEWCAGRSREERLGVKTRYFEQVENLNRDLPRDKRISPVDETGEVRA